jgi:hypothetical protein
MPHFRPQFMESVPEHLEAGVLYVSMELATAIHLCACGCGQEVITPFSPTDWKLCFDGENVSLDPSIGNWSFPCQSHYWIRGGNIRWSTTWSEEEIQSGRAHDRERKNAYSLESKEMVREFSPATTPQALTAPEAPPRPAWFVRVWNRLKVSR